MSVNSEDLSAYYKNSGTVPLASRISLHVRKEMFARFMGIFQPNDQTSVLDVGVTSDASFRESNYFEQLYPYSQRITCVGTEDGSHLAELYPGLRYIKVVGGDPLPFEDDQFDIVFSNAVLEHTGCREAQARFLKEICRVSRKFFVTTPNRWFPIEHHTGLPLLHYLPSSLFRSALRKTKYSYWSEVSNLNILTKGNLKKIIPSNVDATVESVSVFGVPSNLLAYGSKKARQELGS